jgi:hypothetical protein
MANKQRMIVCVLTLLAVVSPAAQSGLAGKWTGTDQNNHPVTLELVVKGEEATGTLSVGPDPVKTLANGKVRGTFQNVSRTKVDSRGPRVDGSERNGAT